MSDTTMYVHVGLQGSNPSRDSSRRVIARSNQGTSWGGFSFLEYERSQVMNAPDEPHRWLEAWLR